MMGKYHLYNYVQPESVPMCYPYTKHYRKPQRNMDGIILESELYKKHNKKVWI